MLGSKNHFFTQPKEILKRKRLEVSFLLSYKGYSYEQIEIYLNAYDFFTIMPSEFDGATIVKDLMDIIDLDLDAMLHDYQYIAYGIAASFSLKFKADWLYAKGQEHKGKGQYSAFSRFLGLTIISIGFVPYTFIKKGKCSDKQKEEFLKEYSILIK